MKKLTITTFLVLLAGMGILAQTTDKTIAAIDSRYNDVAEKARLCEADDEQGEIGDLVMTSLDINARGHQWRAVGIYRPVYKFFYKQIENDERRLYPDQLVFVTADVKVSAVTTREEYLFSETGGLIYYSYKDDLAPGGASATRVWFAAGKAIRVEQGGKARTRLTKEDLATAAEQIATAAKLMQIFKRSIEL